MDLCSGVENHLWSNIASTKEAFKVFAGGIAFLKITQSLKSHAPQGQG